MPFVDLSLPFLVLSLLFTDRSLHYSALLSLLFIGLSLCRYEVGDEKGLLQSSTWLWVNEHLSPTCTACR